MNQVSTAGEVAASHSVPLVPMPGCCSHMTLPEDTFPKTKGSQNALMSNIKKAQVAAKHVSISVPISDKLATKKHP